MKLQRNIKELPPLTGRLDRRFALPRALEIFRRLSLRMDLLRIWPELPYMSFLRSAHKDRQDAPLSGDRRSRSVQHSSFHTHIALSPVITRIVREEYTLPVRELVFGEREREQLERSAPARDAQADPTGAQSRLVKLVQVVDRDRPATVRGTRAPAITHVDSPGDRDVPETQTRESISGEDPGHANRLSYSRPDRDTLAAVAREHGLESASLESIADAMFGDGPDESSPAPILPPEMREFLNLDPAPGVSAKRFAAKRERRSDADDDARDLERSPRVKASAKQASQLRAPELQVRGEQDGMSGITSDAGVSSGSRRIRAARSSREESADAALAVREARRPVREREPEPIREEERAMPSEAAHAAMVQATVRNTLRTLPEPDVEAFADRISRSIERRMQIDRDWRGDL